MDVGDDLKKAREFYSDVGNIARVNGVTIHLILLKGDEDCKISALSNLCYFTGGKILRWSPSQFQHQLLQMMAEPIIASNVIVDVILNKCLTFRNEPKQEDGKILEKTLGNVTVNKKFSFKYALKKEKELEQAEYRYWCNLENYPFQV